MASRPRLAILRLSQHFTTFFEFLLLSTGRSTTDSWISSSADYKMGLRIVLSAGDCRITLRRFVIPAGVHSSPSGSLLIFGSVRTLRGCSPAVGVSEKGCKSLHGNNFPRRSEETS